jgi:hypothetical protein
MGVRISKRTVKEESSDEEEESSDEEEQVVVAMNGADTLVTVEEEGIFSGSMEPPLQVDTKKDVFAGHHLAHWHNCRDHMGHNEPNGGWGQTMPRQSDS